MNSNKKETLIGSGMLHKPSAIYGLTKHRRVQRTDLYDGPQCKLQCFCKNVTHPVPGKAPVCEIETH